MHGFRARLDYWLKHNYFIYKVFNVTASTFMRVWGCFLKTDEKLIIFSAHSRKYNDSPRAYRRHIFR